MSATEANAVKQLARIVTNLHTTYRFWICSVFTQENCQKYSTQYSVQYAH